MTEDVKQDSDAASSQQKQSIDVQLSVPKGKIKTGKFMYPKHHPSFFEQPIFNPQSMGSFELKRVEGNKADKDEDEMIELFCKEDLEGKQYYLSTFPLPTRKKKDKWGDYIEEDEDYVDTTIQNNMVWDSSDNVSFYLIICGALFYLLLCNRSLHSNCLQTTHSLHYVDLDRLKLDVANGASLVKSVIKYGSKCIQSNAKIDNDPDNKCHKYVRNRS
jgi:hypothetical protein